MGSRGRSSTASLSVVSSGPISALRRPSPPDELTDEQAITWREIVDRLPADWFQRENHPLLVQYCRHVVRARHLAQLVDAAQSEMDVLTYGKLLQAEEVQSRAIASLATRMRLTQHSTYDKKRTKPIGATIGKPWREEED